MEWSLYVQAEILGRITRIKRNRRGGKPPLPPPTAKVNRTTVHEAMAVCTDHNQVGMVVIEMITIEVMNIHLGVMLGFETTKDTRCHQFIDREERTMWVLLTVVLLNPMWFSPTH